MPLAPSWVIGKGTKTVAKLGFDLVVEMGVSSADMKVADNNGTVGKSGLICPSCGKTTPISSLRRDRRDKNGNLIYELRRWEKAEFDFQENDIYHERLYAIKYEKIDGKCYYRHPKEGFAKRSKGIIAENIGDWQGAGISAEYGNRDWDEN